jgi:hypothetical protein
MPSPEARPPGVYTASGQALRTLAAVVLGVQVELDRLPSHGLGARHMSVLILFTSPWRPPAPGLWQSQCHSAWHCNFKLTQAGAPGDKLHLHLPGPVDQVGFITRPEV